MKYLKTALFMLIFAALLCVAALADSANTGMDELDVEAEGTSITVRDENNNVATADEFGVYPGGVRYTVTYSGAAAGNYYVIFVLDGKDSSSVPTEGNILYIDQAQADENGVVTFEAYPTNVTSGGRIYITNYDPQATGLLRLASYTYYYPPYTLGDVNNNSEITTYDALLALQISVGRPGFTERHILAADVNKSGEVTTYDALRILQYSVGRIEHF